MPTSASFFNVACRLTSVKVACSGWIGGKVDCAGCELMVRVSDGVNFILPLLVTAGFGEGVDCAGDAGVSQALALTASSAPKLLPAIGAKEGSKNRALRNVALNSFSLLSSCGGSPLSSGPSAFFFGLSFETFSTKRAISFQSSSCDTE